MQQKKKVKENATIGYTGGTFGGKTWKGQCSIPVAVKTITTATENFPLSFAVHHFKVELNHVVDVLGENYLVKQHGISTDGSSNIYQAMEVMDENLEAFVNRQVHINDRAPDCLIVVLRDIVNMVKELHDHNLRCKNLKPSNIFVQNERAKLDPGAATSIHSDNPWLAPEERIKEERQRLAQVERSGSCADMFRLGMMLYYCLTNGKEMPHKPTFAHLSSILPKANHEAIQLILSLLDENFEKRPSAIEVLRHPFFWLSQKRLEFIEIVSDFCGKYVEFRDIVNMIKSPWNDSWTKNVHKSFIEDMAYYTNNNNEEGDDEEQRSNDQQKKAQSPSTCLHLIRNLKDHVVSMSDETLNVLKRYASGMHGVDTPSAEIMYGLDTYFATKFPGLLWRVWNVLKDSDYKEEEMLTVYF